MAFYARNFIFDNIPSEEYGLIISSDGGESRTSGHNVELITEDIYRRHTPFFYGVRQSDMISMPASIRSSNGEITAEDSAYIQRWLFGQMTYKELRIVQGDMEGYYYKCFLLDPQIIRIGNLIVGYDFTIQLDSPFAYGEEITTTISEPGTSTVSFLNLSDNNYYTYPIVEIKMSGSPTTDLYVKVTNQSDDNRVFQLGASGSPLNELEDIVINNDLQSIVSYTDYTKTTLSTEKRIQDLLNGYFFRLVQGINTLYFESVDVYQFIITYTPLKRIS